MQVSSLAIHPEFDGRNLQNDFAVLFTSQNFVLDQHIDTACLPDAGEVFDGTSCFATGWGKDEFGAAGQYQVVLKEIELPVVNHAACEATLRTTRLGQKYKLHDSFLCAGGVAGRDTCKGDGGSPLVCPSKQDPNTYVQAGIVAWGIGCGENNVPGVYADVSKATCWIDQQLTCHYGAQTGDYNSYFGYTSNVCGAWHSNKITELTQKMNAAGNSPRPPSPRWTSPSSREPRPPSPPRPRPSRRRSSPRPPSPRWTSPSSREPRPQSPPRPRPSRRRSSRINLLSMIFSP